MAKASGKASKPLSAPPKRAAKPASSGEAAAGAAMTDKQLREAYRLMLLIRKFEEKAALLYGMKLIGGFCHLYIGQEAVVAGVRAALKQGDQMITSYRAHGHILASGIAPRAVMAELTGRAAGVSGGKGGSMHMFAPQANFFGGHGIVGAQVSLGTGLAFANHYRGNEQVAAIFLGDGAANQGQVFESLNLAALMKLPAVYIIENNRYGMGTSVERASAARDFAHNGTPWGIPGLRVDGMDVRAVYGAVAEALAHCRAGKGPFLLEAATYRFRGHSMSDPAKYRPREEVNEMRAHHDPLTLAHDALAATGMGEAEFAAIEAGIRAEVDDAASFAQSAPEPEPDALFSHVLVEG